MKTDNKDPQKLIVPLSLKVLLVGSLPPEGTISNQSYMYECLSLGIKGISDDDIEPDFMAVVKRDGNDKGAYIHFSLPDALTKAVENKKKDAALKNKDLTENPELEYPSVPDRWLVARLWTEDGKNIKQKYFMLESNALQRKTDKILYNLRSASYPYLQDRDMPYRYIGRAYPVDTGADRVPAAEGYLEGLKAVAPGNPCFSAFFNDSCNVFGFFDNLKDDNGNYFKNINITYAVCGWYQNPNEDILSICDDYSLCSDWLQWNIPKAMAFPAAVLCHGLVNNVAWVDENTDYSNGIPLDLDKPEIALGNNSMEALAAIAESKKPSGFLQERMLNFLLSDLKKKLLEANGLMKSRDEVHKARFGNMSKIRKIGIKENINLNQNEYLKNKDLEGNISEECRSEVKQVNEFEMLLFKNKQEIEERQEDLYDLFYKYVDRYNMDDVDDTDKLLALFADNIHKLGGKIENLRAEQAEISAKIKAQEVILKKKAGTNFKIINMNEQRFWQANDPVLMLYGIDRNYSHGEDGRFSEDNKVLCRTKEQVISSFTLEAMDGIFSKSITLGAEDIFDLKKALQIFDLNKIPDECANIISEAVLLSLNFSQAMASFVASSFQITDKEKINTIAENIKKIQTSPINGEIHPELDKQTLSDSAGFKGVFPEIYSVNYWKQPWSPLYLCWQLKYYPDPLVMEETPRFDNWELVNDDFVYKGQDLSDKDYITYKNRTVITPYAAKLAADILKKEIEDENILNEIKNMSVLSQKLNGFNERLLMRYLQMQTPISMRKLENQAFKDKVSGWLEEYNFEKPEYKKFFSPIRAGYLQIDQINIVDTFGQTMNIKPTGAVVAEDFRYGQSIFEKFVMLPPRIVQPSRINFTWVNKNKSPLCGWLLPNHVERSISCFDENGILLGSLQNLRIENNPIVWRLPPEKGGMISELPEDIDETLYAILNNIIKSGSSPAGGPNSNESTQTGVLDDLLLAIDSSLWNINPNSQQIFKGLSLFVGRPLMVVRSTVKLELLGKQKKCKFKEKSMIDAGVFPYPHLEKAKFNIKVGRKENHGDGVVGYFVDSDYSKLYLSATDTESTSKYFENKNEILLTVDENEKPTQITFLMDSAGSIDFVSGFLPIKSMKLPEKFVKESLEKMYLTVFSAPMLTDVFDVSLPLPKIPGKKFSWLYLDENKSPMELNEISDTTEEGFFPEIPFKALEGWLKLKLNDKEN
jgi:hypothetical protein